MITVSGTRTLEFHWMQQASNITILPPSLSAYQSMPPLSPRLSISNTGALVTNGNQLQEEDAGRYMIASSNYTGALQLTISISGEHGYYCYRLSTVNVFLS